MRARIRLVGVFAGLLCLGPRPSAQPPAADQGLVGSWLLVSEQRGVDGPMPTTVRGVRGLLVFDAAGHTLEVIDHPADSPPAPGLSDDQARFYEIAGAWGEYEANLDGGRITYRPVGGRSPNVMGTEFSRAFELEGDRLSVTSQPGELHTFEITRWVWERVPTVAGLSAEARNVVGFWQHEVEGRKDATTGEILSETRRAPSVIVYTPTGFVGVHFPNQDRPRFASAEPTEAEAREARGYLGYFAALGVYPGMVFHNILGGGLTPGSTLRRFFEVRGDELHLTFPPNTSREGRRVSTYVRLRRLSDADDMLGR